MVWAYQGRAYLEYEQTAEIWAVIAEVNRDKSRKPTPFTAQDKFMRPGAKVHKPGRLTAETFKTLKGAFTTPTK
jgi:hypothetical protein